MSFFQQVTSECQVLLANVRKLSSHITHEEELVQGAKETATAAYALGSLIQNYAQQGDQIESKKALTQCSTSLREAIIGFIKHARELFGNPLDYVSQQALQNARNTVLTLLKQLIEAIRILQPQQASTAKTILELQDCTTKCLAALADMALVVHNSDKIAFKNCIVYEYSFIPTFRTNVTHFVLSKIEPVLSALNKFKDNFLQLLSRLLMRQK